MAIVLSFLLGALYLFWQRKLFSLFIPLLPASAAIALLGWWDDHKTIGAALRLLVQTVCALFFVYFTLGFHFPLQMSPLLLRSAASFIFALLFLVWLTNLFNFMDGIDGLAGIEAFSVAIGAAFLCAGVGAHALALLLMVLAAASLGFLVLNWQPAKLFMGDVGSSFLGFVFGALALLSISMDARLFSTWFILLGVFVVDATYTLLRRCCAGKKIYQAHRDHAYQHAVQRGRSHSQVSVVTLLVNVFWLFPLAYLSQKFYGHAFWLCLLAYAPLVFLAVHLRAGEAMTHKRGH